MAREDIEDAADARGLVIGRDKAGQARRRRGPARDGIGCGLRHDRARRRRSQIMMPPATRTSMTAEAIVSHSPIASCASPNR